MTTHNLRNSLLASFCALAFFCPAAQATQLSYAPTNPIFQPGNALTAPTLLGLAQAQKGNRGASAAGAGAGLSTADLIRNSIIARIGSNINNQIFCGGSPGCANSGTFDLGDGNIINFTRSGGILTITVHNPDGSSTDIVIPDV